MAASNQSHGNARSLVVFHTEDLGSPPMPQGSWARYKWKTNTDYESLYNALVGALNAGQLPSGDTINSAQAYWALIEMSNARDGDATLSLFWMK